MFCPKVGSKIVSTLAFFGSPEVKKCSFVRGWLHFSNLVKRSFWVFWGSWLASWARLLPFLDPPGVMFGVIFGSLLGWIQKLTKKLSKEDPKDDQGFPGELQGLSGGSLGALLGPFWISWQSLRGFLGLSWGWKGNLPEASPEAERARPEAAPQGHGPRPARQIPKIL